MKKKDLILYASVAVLLAFSTQQAKADEQTSSDQTSENTAAIVLKADTSSNTEAYRNETTQNNVEFAEYVTEEKIETESPSSAVFTSLSSNRKEEQTRAATSGERFPLQKQKPVVRFQSRIIIQWQERLMQLFVMLKLLMV